VLVRQEVCRAYIFLTHDPTVIITRQSISGWLSSVYSADAKSWRPQI